MTAANSRLILGGLFLLAVWHSLDVSNPKAWTFRELKRDLRGLAAKSNNRDEPLILSGLNATSPVRCHNNASYCCGLWNVTADDWWMHHPDWEVVHEDSFKFCFAPVQNDTKRAFIRDLHWLQWQFDIDESSTNEISSLERPLPSNYNFSVNCSDMRATVNINSGYGASLMWLIHSFWEAYTQRKPFQTIQKWPWLYTFSRPDNNSTWANCKERDQTCFYLPISPCSREDKNQPRYEKRPENGNETQVMQRLWIEEYLSRPKQFLRQQLYHLRQPIEHTLRKNGCLAMHVRRGDAGAPKPPYRRYAAVQEYLDQVPNLTANTTIFLLTDDASTIEEVRQHHASKHHWVYTNKIRVHGVEQGFNNHIPAHSSGPDELAYISVEQELASKYCDSLVHGRSGYAYTLFERMKSTGRPIQTYYLETRVLPRSANPFKGKPQERAAFLMQQVQDLYQKQNESNAQLVS
ncbi:expressed unknown protein [Seminavis robusta]|uniref:Uncharacterized protein n=1 Tax=Seminavis robusta TaxID=568900 RepID=A0A9N8H499_9STRA|nr:expressed unknown protein [Seminavis robusta]|eukprot:Sro108_g054280.1 n/a (463) ;mRNA; f:84140-85644